MTPLDRVIHPLERTVEAVALALALLLLFPSPTDSQPSQPPDVPTPAVPEAVETVAPNSPLARIEALKQSDRRWIEIRLKTQRLVAWEGNRPVRAIAVSTGKRSTPTPTGSFAIQSKLRAARMRGSDYDISGVPYVMYYSGNYGIHGTTWHRRFGTPVSHGCTNVAVDHAKWLFGWASVGTPVIVRE